MDKEKSKSVVKREVPQGKIREESEVLAAYEQVGDSLKERNPYRYQGDAYEFFGRNEY